MKAAIINVIPKFESVMPVRTVILEFICNLSLRNDMGFFAYFKHSPRGSVRMRYLLIEFQTVALLDFRKNHTGYRSPPYQSQWAKCVFLYCLFFVLSLNVYWNFVDFLCYKMVTFLKALNGFEHSK